MAFHSTAANALIKPVGYNPRPPYLQKFYGLPFIQGQCNDKICWLQPMTTLHGEVLWPSIHPRPMR